MTSPRAIVFATFALMIGGVAIGTTEFVSMGLLPQIAATLGVDIPTAGHIISAYALGVVVGAPTIAVLYASKPRKGLLMALMVLFVVGNSASALATSHPMMLAARFVAGIPHGAYFGVGALVAASLVEPLRAGRQIGRMMYGIPIANLLGVPLTTWLGQHVGWRSAYWTVAFLGLVTLVLVARFVPRTPGDARATGRRELGALKSPALWISMLAGAFGFGGMFAMFSYIAPTVTEVAHQPASVVQIYLFAYGLGGLVGAEVAGRMSEWSVAGSLAAAFVLMAGFLTAFHLLVPHKWLGVLMFALAAAVASIIVVNLQLQLMADAREAQTLGAALNHSALNIANAFGAWVGGLVIAAGWGYRMPSLVGAAMALTGLLFLGVHRLVVRRSAAA